MWIGIIKDTLPLFHNVLLISSKSETTPKEFKETKEEIFKEFVVNSS